MDKEFAKDLYEGLTKIADICNWLKDCLMVESGRNAKAWQEEKETQLKNIIEINNGVQNLSKGDEEMKHIRKRSDNRWEGRVTINGVRKSVYAKTQKECYRKYVALKKSQRIISNKTHKTTLYEFAKTWLNTFKKAEISKKTYEMYEHIIEKHFISLNKNITNYNLSELQEFLNALGQTRLKEIAYQTIKQVFRKALQLEIIKKDPCEFLVKGKIEKGIRNSFSVSEQKKIFENLRNNTISKYILAYLLLGARLSELSTIKKSNIHDNYVLIEGTKTKSARRWVKISDKYQEILLSYKEPIFNCQSDTVKAKMRSFFEKIGIKGSTHMLRHTFSTNLYYLGADDNTRKQYLGHSSIMVTNDIYTHLDPTIKKTDILGIYGDLYPSFDPVSDPAFFDKR